MALNLPALGRVLDHLAATNQELGTVQNCSLSGAAQHQQSDQRQQRQSQSPSQQRPTNDECFQLQDHRTGMPLARARYRLDWPGGTVEGTTDENGFTQRIGTEYRVEQITVTYYPPDQELAEDNHHPGGCD